MIINSFVSLTNKLIPSAIPAGKIVGFLQIIVLLIIYSTNLKKKEVRHIRATSRAIYCEESQTSGRNVIQLRVGMSHQFI